MKLEKQYWYPAGKPTFIGVRFRWTSKRRWHYWLIGG
jgi:hypothetical protein